MINNIFLRSSNILSFIFSCAFLIIYGYITNSQGDQLPDGLIPQLVEHCTGFAEIVVSNSVQAYFFFFFLSGLILTTVDITWMSSVSDILCSQYPSFECQIIALNQQQSSMWVLDYSPFLYHVMSLLAIWGLLKGHDSSKLNPNDSFS